MIQGSKASAGQQRSQGDPEGMGTFSGASHTAVNFSWPHTGPAALPCSHAPHTEPVLPACSLQQLPPTYMCTVPSPAGIHIRTHIQNLRFPPFSCSVSAMYSLTQQCSSPVIHAHPRASRAPSPLLAALYAQPALPPPSRRCLLHANTRTCTDPPEQCFAWFPMAIPPPSSQHSLSAS